MAKKLTAVILAACLAALPALAELPVSEKAPDKMILGESREEFVQDVTLYFGSGGGTELTAVTRALLVEPGETVIERALEELMTPTGSTELLSVAPGDARVTGYEFSHGLVTVDLSADPSGLQNGEAMLLMYTAISNTLMSIEGVEAVNVLVHSRQEYVSGLPMGVIGRSDAGVAVLQAQYQAEEERFFKGTENASLERRAALYFPSTNGQWILPEVRNVTFTSDDYASALMAELIKGSAGGAAYSDFLSGGVSVMSQTPEIHVDESGMRVLDVYLSSALRDYIMLQGVSEWQLAAAITLTMCSFIPELDGVRLNIGENAVTSLSVRGNSHDFENGVMRRGDFSMYVGGVATLYLSDGAGKLTAVERAMSARRSVSAYSLMLQLISGPSSGDVGTQSVMPAGVAAYDLLGVDIVGGVAEVNMSGEFYRLCQSIDQDAERTLVYSIVNTLCGVSGVKAVHILIEGKQVKTLTNSIYIGTDLMPNPGLAENM